MQVELVQTTTRDSVRLDGILQTPNPHVSRIVGVDGFCLVHGTGGNFYGSTLFDELAERLLDLGSAVLRVNTRGHDGISTAQTGRGGRRLGAAYEIVDESRHDLAAWTEWLRQRVGPRVGLIGHSLGAVKCLYAMAHEPQLGAACLIGLSPPRLSYSWFCTSPEGPPFLETIAQAERHVEAGQAATLMEVKLPLSMVITAGGYVEKYGPDERYNYLRFIASVRCPTLITFGEVERANNMAFRSAVEDLAVIDRRPRTLMVETIAAADHFYGGVRPALFERLENWLRRELR
jgi:pimeloyl-ACP methyl ester carboxylesterase